MTVANEGKRVIDGLVWAKACPRPDFIKPSRARGLKAQGLRFERSVGGAMRKQFESVLCGQWFHYCDKNGLGWCQPDILVEANEAIIVAECKLSECEDARRQIVGLYRPILECVFEKKVIGVVIVRHLTREPRRELIADGFISAIRSPMEAPRTIQWLGRGRI